VSRTELLNQLLKLRKILVVLVVLLLHYADGRGGIIAHVVKNHREENFFLFRKVIVYFKLPIFNKPQDGRTVRAKLACQLDESRQLLAMHRMKTVEDVLDQGAQAAAGPIFAFDCEGCHPQRYSSGVPSFGVKKGGFFCARCGFDNRRRCH
jgi:hypothetical protein